MGFKSGICRKYGLNESNNLVEFKVRFMPTYARDDDYPRSLRKHGPMIDVLEIVKHGCLT